MTSPIWFHLLFMHICFGSLVNYLKADATGFPPWNRAILYQIPQCCALSHPTTSRGDDNWEWLGSSKWDAKHIWSNRGDKSWFCSLSQPLLSFGTFIPKLLQLLFIPTEISWPLAFVYWRIQMDFEWAWAPHTASSHKTRLRPLGTMGPTGIYLKSPIQNNRGM